MTPNPMREQVIEAVARATFKAALGQDNFEKHDKPTRDYWLLKATAALTAVLDATAEPTVPMQSDGSIAIKGADDPVPMLPANVRMIIARTVWRAMHAALRRNLTGGDDGEGE